MRQFKQKNLIMKKVLLLLFVVVLASCTQEKIGYVDSVKIMKDYEEQKESAAKFKVKTDALTKKRDSISQVYQLEMQAFQIRAQKMNDQKAQQEYGLLQQKGQIMAQQLQQEEQTLTGQQQTVRDSIISTIKKEIKAFGKAKGYSYILGGGDTGTVLYGTEANDLTVELLKILNDKYK